MQLKNEVSIKWIEKCEPGIIMDLCKVFEESFSEYETIFEVPTWLMEWENLTSLISVVATYQGKTAGFLQLFERSICVNGNVLKAGLIAKICVAPFARRQGIAGSMINSTYAYAKNNKFDILTAFANRHERISDIFQNKGFLKMVSRYGMVRVLIPSIMAAALEKEDYLPMLEQMAVIEEIPLKKNYIIKRYTKDDYCNLVDLISRCKYDYYMLVDEKEANWRYLLTPPEMNNDAKLLFYMNKPVGFINYNIRDFWFRGKKKEVKAVNLIIDELIFDKEHSNAMKAMLNEVLSEGKCKSVDNVVHFFAADTKTVRMFEDMKFIPEIDTLLFYQVLNEKIVFEANVIKSYFDYYI